MDLSETLYTINHGLLLAKLNSLGFSNQTLSFVQQIKEKYYKLLF